MAHTYSTFGRPLSVRYTDIYYSLETIQNIVDKYKKEGRSETFLMFIKNDLDNGVPIEHINVYANAQLNGVQAKVVRDGIVNDRHTLEQFALYSNPSFNENQMTVIRAALNNAMLIEQVELFAKPELSCDHMSKLMAIVKNSISIKEAKNKVALYMLENL